MIRWILAAVAWFGILGGAAAGEPARVTLEVPESAEPLAISRPIAEGTSLPTDTAWQLVAEGAAPVAAQVAPGVAEDGTAAAAGQILAVLPPGGPLARRLEPVADAQPVALRFEEAGDTSLRLMEGDRPVLTYNFGTIVASSVPENEPRRRRACYIHPVWGLRGEVLTDDFPRDHYHHHGIFWTWPHVEIEGQQYDLWMGSDIQQRFESWLGRQAGPVAAVLGVENGWYVGERRVMIERVWLRVYRASDTQRVLDFTLTWIPVDRPITLRGAEEKSYGGLTMRFQPPPGSQPVITVPQGPTTADLPDTPLPWADFTTTFAGADGPSGGALFVPADHPDYPPTWLTRHYGPLCIGWPGVKGQTFPPGKPIRLEYRVLIHRDAWTTEQLQAAYAAYLLGRTAAL